VKAIGLALAATLALSASYTLIHGSTTPGPRMASVRVTEDRGTPAATGCQTTASRTCGKIQCCKSKTCCVRLRWDQPEICSTTKVDCIPAPVLAPSAWDDVEETKAASVLPLIDAMEGDEADADLIERMILARDEAIAELPGNTAERVERLRADLRAEAGKLADSNLGVDEIDDQLRDLARRSVHAEAEILGAEGMAIVTRRVAAQATDP